MSTIPYQRFAGRVAAFGAYGAPLIRGRLDRRTLVIVGFVAIMLALYWAGVIDLATTGFALAAGPTTTELADKYDKDKAALKAYMDDHVKKDSDGKPETDSGGRPIYDLDAEGVKKVREMNADLDQTVEALKSAREVDRAHDAANGDADPRIKTTGHIKDDIDVQNARPSLRITARARVKALLDESAKDGGGLAAFRDAGYKGTKTLFELEDQDEADALIDGAKTTILLTDITPTAARRPDIVPSAQLRITVSDLMASGTTDSNTLEYYEETTFTNAAAETAENTAKPESTIDFTLRTDTVRKIATWIPISDEALNDNAQLRSYVENRLLYMVRQREESQLLVGNGTPPNIQGILNRSGIQTQAKGADPTPDAFFKAFTKVQTTGDADPDGFVIHPDDWQDVRLLRTADGLYIFGNPNDEVQVRMWGYPGRVTTGITSGTGLVGAFRTYAQVFRRDGLRVVASTEHASYFIENKVALLAETRLALAVYRPAAFCTVTGI